MSESFDFELAGPLPQNTVLLEASAGTGKTYTIAHLAVRYIAEEGAEIDKILVVTFTEAATRELRDRIRKRIRDAIDALGGKGSEDGLLLEWAEGVEPSNRELYRQRLERALSDFDAAGISTIHGFCSRVLSQAAFESGADYAAELVTDPSALYRDIVFDHLSLEISRLSEEEYEAFGDEFGNIKELSRLAEDLIRNPSAKVLPDDLPGIEELEAKRLVSRGALRNILQTSLSEFRAEVERGREQDLFKGDWRKNPALLDEALAVLERIRDRDEALSTVERTLLLEVSPPEWLNKRKEKRWGALGDHSIYDRLGEHLSDEAELATVRVLRFQLALFDRIRNELPKRKRNLGILTFDDLLALVAEALSKESSRLREFLRARFRLAMIDEFQDTDSVQWAIFRAIFHEGSLPLLLIGDPKQAIYSFRGADLEVYLEAREMAHARYRLATNFRSDGPLVQAVNDLFQYFDASLGHPRLDYEAASAHHERPRLEIGAEPFSKLRLLPRPEELPAKLPNVSDNAAACVAWDLLGLLQSGARLQERSDAEPRPISPGDCAVLVSSNRRAKAVKAALSALGVPSVLRTDESVFDSEEAEQLAIWLRALAEPTDPSRLWAFLASSLVGLTAEEIDSVQRDEVRHEKWISDVSAWSRLFHRQGMMRAFRAMVHQLDVEERLAKLSDSERRLTDLWHAAEILHVAMTSERLDAESLALYLERQRGQEQTRQDAERLRLETDADAVEVVTIHRSKGLEYPIVFCADLDSEPEARPPLRYSLEGERVFDLAPNEEAKELARREILHERIRLAYVALTRAKHCSIVYFSAPWKKDRQSALDWLFFGDMPASAWNEAQKDIFNYLSSRYRDASGRILVSAEPFEVKTPKYQRQSAERLELVTAQYTRPTPLDTRFRWSSYSSIVRGRQAELSERGGSDEDFETDAASAKGEIGDSEASLPAHLASFKHGTQFGNLIHDIFEKIDFQNPGDLASEAERRLDLFGMRSRLQAHPELSQDIGKMLEDALMTKIMAGDDGFSLSDIPAKDRMNELGFTFSIGGQEGAHGEISMRTIREALLRYPRPSFPSSYGEALDRLRVGQLRGLIHGSIDLVLRRNGRYYVLDYKSNHLGDKLGDYSQKALLAPMQKAHYLLQAQIYGLALHRFLRQRLGPQYDPSEHLGGIIYLFLRGMRESTGDRFGVYFDEAPAEALLALDRAFTTLGGEL